jgi:dolichyl-phosphate-mannose-protein mannosyltransferase
MMSSPGGSVRHRNPAAISKKAKDASSTGIAAPQDPELDALVKANLNGKVTRSEWDYKLALGIITALAFATRFWGISHPNEVVFDEVHFGKVSNKFSNRRASIPRPQ